MTSDLSTRYPEVRIEALAAAMVRAFVDYAKDRAA